MIPYGKQNISQEDIDAVVEVLTSDYLTQGPKVAEFEQALLSITQAKYAIATNSATSALHIACLALDVGLGDYVWTSPISFVASANCGLYCQATVDFVDIDINTGNISVTALEKKLTLAEKNNQLPKVLIVVHLAGYPCDMREIYALAQYYHFKVIEDASHAIGSHYHQNPTGSGQFSDITIFSFHPVKIVTSAEGGMAICNSALLAEKMRQYRCHGIVNEPSKMTEPSHGPWYYQQIALGYNYRMTDLQAALGVSQLTRLPAFVKKRNEIAAQYNQAFEKTALSLLTPPEYSLSAYHLYIVLLPQNKAYLHETFIRRLRAKDIFAHVHYIPIHLQPFYQQLGFKQGDFPVAEQYYQRAISLPLYPDLTTPQQNYIIETMLDLLDER